MIVAETSEGNEKKSCSEEKKKKKARQMVRGNDIMAETKQQHSRET